MTARRSPLRSAPPSGHRTQGGSFILEALIGILIFSFGVLGLVGLQAQSMRHVADAQYRGEAVYLANALVARMWSDNPANLAAKYQAGGAGYNTLLEMVKTLPGASDPANAPEVLVDAGPGIGSSLVTVTIYWQAPGEPIANRHNYTTMAVVGLNP
ncbi:MAG: pilus assembly protein PilV [Casimicrobiaceae bacterium]